MELQINSAEQAIADALYSHSKSVGEAFRLVDDRKDGQVTAEELRVALQRYGLDVPLTTVSAIIRKYDHVGKGTLSLVDFTRFHEDHSAPLRPYAQLASSNSASVGVATHLDSLGPSEQQRLAALAQTVRSALRARVGTHATSHHLAQLFTQLDTHRTSFLTYDEIYWALCDQNIVLSAKELVDLLWPFDKLHNGYISFQEFADFISEKTDSAEDPGDGILSGLAHSSSEPGTPTEPFDHSPTKLVTQLSICIDDNSDDIVAISKIARRLDEKRLKLRKAFVAMDTCGNGCLSVDDFIMGLEEQGIHISRKRAEDLVNKYSAEGDGMIRYYEFVRMLSASLAQARDESLAAGEAKSPSTNVAGVDRTGGDEGHVSQESDHWLEAVKEVSQTVYSDHKSLHSSFEDLARGGRVISREDFGATLEKHLGVLVTEKEVASIFTRFCSKADGQLRYSDFVRMLAAAGTRL